MDDCEHALRLYDIIFTIPYRVIFRCDLCGAEITVESYASGDMEENFYLDEHSPKEFIL